MPRLRAPHHATALTLLAALVVTATPAASAYPASGRLAVTAPDRVTPLDAGGSATLFSVVPPGGARCAADSATGGYRLYSFLVPHGQSPRQLSFRTTVPSKWYGLYTEVEYYSSNLDPGTAELMTTPDDFTWSRLSPALLLGAGAAPSAAWDAGLACVTAHGAVENYWITGFDFLRSGTDRGGFTWRVVAPAPVPHGSGNYWLGLAPFLAAAVLAATAVGLRRLERRRARTRRRPAGTLATNERT